MALCGLLLLLQSSAERPYVLTDDAGVWQPALALGIPRLPLRRQGDRRDRFRVGYGAQLSEREAFGNSSKSVFLPRNIYIVLSNTPTGPRLPPQPLGSI